MSSPDDMFPVTEQFATITTEPETGIATKSTTLFEPISSDSNMTSKSPMGSGYTATPSTKPMQSVSQTLTSSKNESTTYESHSKATFQENGTSPETFRTGPAQVEVVTVTGHDPSGMMTVCPPCCTSDETLCLLNQLWIENNHKKGQKNSSNIVKKIQSIMNPMNLTGPLFLHVFDNSQPPKHWQEVPAEAVAAPAVGGMMIIFVIAEIVLLMVIDANLIRRQVQKAWMNVCNTRKTVKMTIAHQRIFNVS